MPLAAVLLAFAACVAPADRSLVGLWESTVQGQGSVGHALEFKADGSFLSSFTIIIQLAYKLDRGQLLTADDEAALKKETDGPRIEIQGDVLTLTDAKGATIRKERVGRMEDPSRPIVGVWRYKHDTGPMAYERYTAAGLLLFRLPMSSNTGCYSLSAGTLTVDAERTRRATFASRLEGEALTLRRDDKEPNSYRRAQTIWYPRE